VAESDRPEADVSESGKGSASEQEVQGEHPCAHRLPFCAEEPQCHSEQASQQHRDPPFGEAAPDAEGDGQRLSAPEPQPGGEGVAQGRGQGRGDQGPSGEAPDPPGQRDGRRAFEELQQQRGQKPPPSSGPQHVHRPWVPVAEGSDLHAHPPPSDGPRQGKGAHPPGDQGPQSDPKPELHLFGPF